jgi:hypothetical protein
VETSRQLPTDDGALENWATACARTIGRLVGGGFDLFGAEEGVAAEE